LDYWRNPTKEELKFGHGSIHYRNFDFAICFNENGFLKLRVKPTDDGLVYHYCGREYCTTSKAKLEKLEIK
jgi:hypothetical protein